MNKICFSPRLQYRYLSRPVVYGRPITVLLQLLQPRPSPRSMCVAGIHEKSGYSDTSHPRSRYGKVLRRSKVYRGERRERDVKLEGRSGTYRPIIQPKEPSQHILNKTRSTTEARGEKYSDTEKVVEGQSLSSIHRLSYQEPTFSSVVHASGSKTENSGQHIFDEEYFGNIVTAFTGSETSSSNASNSEVIEEKPLNHFDDQYFKGITRYLTSQADTLNTRDNEKEQSENMPLEDTNDDNLNAISMQDPQDSNIFDHHYFGNFDLLSNGGSLNNVLQNEYSRNLNREHCSMETKAKQMVSPANDAMMNPQLPVSKDEERWHVKVDAGDIRVMEQSIDTSQSESDFFKQEFFKKQTRNMVESSQHNASKELKQEFSPAEKVSEFAAIDVSSSENADSYLQSSSNIHISLEDKMQLEAQKESIERLMKLRVGGGGIEDLEPEVGEVIKASKKKRVNKIPKLKREVKYTGTPDPSIPISEHNCSGCGAALQCQEHIRPGYMPSEKFKPLAEANELSDAVCQRCWYFVHMKQALSVSVDAENYSKIIQAIQTKCADILVLVDLVDFPCSVIPDLKDMVGPKSHMIIVGNKIDLLPKDAPDYLKRVENILLETCIQENVCSREQIQKIHLISAKTGYGVENLITTMQMKWGAKNDIYLVGTANIGKSTLFNALLNSDLSKTKAHYLINQATISRWPGTTLSVLKFPVMKPTKEKLFKRNLRLEEERKATHDKPRYSITDKREIDFRAYVKGNVGKSFSLKLREDNDTDAEDIDELQPPVSGKFEDPFNTMHPDINLNPKLPMPREWKSQKKQLPFSFHPQEFELGKWFYDTPGVLHNRQMLTYLTMDELKETMANKVIIPRSLIMKPGQVIFLGGLGRLDYVQGVDSIYFTVFASEGIPVRHCNQEEADEFYKTHAGEHFFRVPIGGDERMKTFPKLMPVDFEVIGCGWQKSVSDILLSSAGWVSITAGRGMLAQLRAFTPNGNGCFKRQPALLPYAINMKGRRLSRKKPFYHVDPKCVLRFM